MSKSMEDLLKYWGISNLERSSQIPARAKRYRIWKKTDSAGRPYWGFTHFYGMDCGGISADRDLGWLEWDGNELYVSVHTEEKIPALLKRAAGIMKYWKSILEKHFPDTPFYIFACYDDGAHCEIYDGSEPPRAMTLRFWAVRDGKTLLDFDGMENNIQPVMWYKCGF